MQNPALAPCSIDCSKRKMPNKNQAKDEDRFTRQDRPYSARLFLVIVAIIVIVIGIGFFMMLFTH
jgi:hypothetical protein